MLVVSDSLANKYLLTSEAISERATDATMMPVNVPCAATGMDPAACAAACVPKRPWKIPPPFSSRFPGLLEKRGISSAPSRKRV